jgi:adenylylsulfate kinase-like enzyme
MKTVEIKIKGFPSSGKSTIGHLIEKVLSEHGIEVQFEDVDKERIEQNADRYISATREQVVVNIVTELEFPSWRNEANNHVPPVKP